MSTAILWLHGDLRLADNPALAKALAAHDRVLPVFFDAPAEGVPWAPGAASRWWLHHSLTALDAAIEGLGSRLIVRRGPVARGLAELARETGAQAVYWNRRYEPAQVATERAVEGALATAGVSSESTQGSLLVEPGTLRTAAGNPYRVFTPFWRAAQKVLRPEPPLPAPQALPPVPGTVVSDGVPALELLPREPWDAGLAASWQPGEGGALARLEAFLEGPVARYKERRDYPPEPATSRLSPHLHFGELSPRQVAWALRTGGGPPAAPSGPSAGGTPGPWSGSETGAEAFLRQLGWREFAHHVLYHFPHTADAPLDRRFEAFPWRRGYDRLLAAWQRGHTGVPLVDAGMRELWATGWMHNRVRMVVASFLAKNLRIPWLEGARWFWDTLVDADLANNTLGWQWASGSGADAAPYFRVFNPVLQGKRFDPSGAYVRRWLPELARLPDRWLHHPWEAPPAVRTGAGVRLGEDYPLPLVDLQESRAEALAAYRAVTDAR